jgi:sugar lactone lactonase YvrE
MRHFAWLVLGGVLVFSTVAAQMRDPRLARIETVGGIAESVGNLYYPQGVAVDGGGTLFVADTNRDRVLRVVNGRASVVFKIPRPDGLAVDTAGNLYVASRTSHHVGRLRPDGVFEVVAGTGRSGVGGDGGPGRSARLSYPTGVAVDADGNVFIADLQNHRVRKVTKDGIITTVAGTGKAGSRGDEGLATQAQLNGPENVAVDANGNLYITDQDNGRVRRVARDGTITTVAKMKGPIGVAVDGAGNLFVADTTDHRILRMSPQGERTVVAGKGRRAYNGDGGAAVEASLNFPEQLVVDHEGSIFVADTYNHAIRKLVHATAPAPRLGVAFVPSARPAAGSVSAPPSAVILSPVTGPSTPVVPDPVLVLGGRIGPPENNTFQLAIQNRDAYVELFRAAPELPPCGSYANVSRTLVDIYTADGARVYGSCAITSLNDLDTLRASGPPGTRLFIVLTDRATRIRYRSNVVELP